MVNHIAILLILMGDIIEVDGQESFMYVLTYKDRVDVSVRYDLGFHESHIRKSLFQWIRSFGQLIGMLITLYMNKFTGK